MLRLLKLNTIYDELLAQMHTNPRMRKVDHRDWKLVAIPFSISIPACTVLYLGVLNRAFAVLDDYRMVTAVQAMRTFRIEGHASTELGTGRLIPALLFDLVWYRVKDISDLHYVRWIALAIVLFTILSLMTWFLKISEIPLVLPGVLLVPASLFLISLPSIIATVTWAQKATQLIAFPLAVFGGVAYSRRDLNWTWRMTGFALITAASFTYQQFGMLAIFPVALWACNPSIGLSGAAAFRRITEVSLACFTSLLLNIIFVRIYAPDVLDDVGILSNENRLNALLWSYLPKSVHLFVSKSNTSLLLTIAILGTLVSLAITVSRNSARILFASFISTGMSSLVTLGGAVDISYRFVFPGQVTIWLGVWLTIMHALACSARAKSRFRFVLVPGLLLMSITFGLQARSVSGSVIAARNATDLSQSLCHLNNAVNSSGITELVFRLDKVSLTGQEAVYSEIGLLARHEGWILSDQLNLLTASDPAYESLRQLPLIILDQDAELPHTDTTFVADLQSSCLLDADSSS